MYLLFKKDVEKMKVAYELLYNVENSLRFYIKQKMEEYYGIHWNQVAPRKEHNRPPTESIVSLNFTDYIAFISLYPKAFQPNSSKFSTSLRELYPIRNKVAHHHLLNNSEFQTLQFNSKFLLSFIEEQLIIYN